MHPMFSCWGFFVRQCVCSILSDMCAMICAFLYFVNIDICVSSIIVIYPVCDGVTRCFFLCKKRKKKKK